MLKDLNGAAEAPDVTMLPPPTGAPLTLPPPPSLAPTAPAAPAVAPTAAPTPAVPTLPTLAPSPVVAQSAHAATPSRAAAEPVVTRPRAEFGFDDRTIVTPCGLVVAPSTRAMRRTATAGVAMLVAQSAVAAAFVGLAVLGGRVRHLTEQGVADTSTSDPDMVHIGHLVDRMFLVMGVGAGAMVLVAYIWAGRVTANLRAVGVRVSSEASGMRWLVPTWSYLRKLKDVRKAPGAHLFIDLWMVGLVAMFGGTLLGAIKSDVAADPAASEPTTTAGLGRMLPLSWGVAGASLVVVAAACCAVAVVGRDFRQVAAARRELEATRRS